VAGRFDQKKHGSSEQLPEKEDVQEKEEAPDAEGAQREQNHLQNQVGNQAILSMLGQAGMTGAAGIEIEPSVRTREDREKETPAHGGEDDGDPGPITLQDLTQTWNPGMRRTDDRPSFLEPMPDDELPPEDDAFLEAVDTCDDPIPLPEGAQSLDPLLEPSAEVVRIALTHWARAAGRWAAPDLTWQLLRRLVAPPVPALQDPHGRVLPSRSRAAAIATAMLLDAPAIRRAPTHTTASALSFALELAARRHRVTAVEVVTEATRAERLPVALDIFREQLGEAGDGEVVPRAPTTSSLATLSAILDDLTRYEDPASLVPEVATTLPGPDPDDPLGLDAVMDSFTGGPPEPSELLYDAAIQTAERVASAAARSRVLYAGTGIAVAEVARLGDAGVPVGNLEAAMGAYDRDVQGCLQLLLEIARAAQRRSVPPEGIHAGLRRAARSLDRLRARGTRQLVEVIGGILPGDAELVAPERALPDAVHGALTVGRPAEALPWVEAQPPSLDRDTALVLLRAVAGALPSDLLAEVRTLRDRWRAERPDTLVGTALDVLLGAVALFNGHLEEALGIADDLLEHGRRRGNGTWVVEGALLGMEVHLARGDEDALADRRHRVGNLLSRMGARGALSLLARWTPPELDDDDLA
jgi:hypothetical protein